MEIFIYFLTVLPAQNLKQKIYAKCGCYILHLKTQNVSFELKIVVSSPLYLNEIISVLTFQRQLLSVVVLINFPNKN